ARTTHVHIANTDCRRQRSRAKQAHEIFEVALWRCLKTPLKINRQLDIAACIGPCRIETFDSIGNGLTQRCQSTALEGWNEVGGIRRLLFHTTRAEQSRDDQVWVGREDIRCLRLCDCCLSTDLHVGPGPRLCKIWQRSTGAHNDRWE